MAHDLDLNRFTKLLRMTTSMSDGEALNAIRMANAMLVEHRLGWPDLLKREVVREDENLAEAAMISEFKKLLGGTPWS